MAVAKITPVFDPPAACAGCRFYAKYRGDCKSVFWHLMKEGRDGTGACPSKETGAGTACTGGKCHDCAPGVVCDD